MKLLVLTLLSVPALALAGCAGSAADAGYTTHEVSEWKALLESTPGALILDVRTAQEFNQGHIEGAQLIPHTDVNARRDELPADKSTPIFVYCRSGSRSATASAVLAELGYTNVHNMAGGVLDWSAAGYPLVA